MVIGRRLVQVRRLGVGLVLGAGSLAAASLLVAVLEGPARVPNASAAYLIAVVVVAVAVGTEAAVVVSAAAFLLYDFFFVPPYGTLTVRDADEWVNLVLLLVVGIVVGPLAGAQRSRAEAALARVREARALAAVSRALATTPRAREALPIVVREIDAATQMTRIWFGIGDTPAQEEIVAESAPGVRAPGIHCVLGASPTSPGEWRLIHVAGAPRTRPGATRRIYRVPIKGPRVTLGSLWVERSEARDDPTEEETRLLAATADQVGQALERDRLASEAMGAEVARRSNALKTALLDSVSHDLRTPLASIRASAGALMDPEVHWSEDEQRAYARTIDKEAERLNAFVGNLLDMSRIEAGDMHRELEVHPRGDLVASAVRGHGPSLSAHPVAVEVAADLPPVEVDPVFLEHILGNLLENACRYVPAGAPIRITAARASAERIRLTVEDGGRGVPPESLPRLFDKFYRVPRRGEGSRRGTGIGLAVVQGMARAMGGDARARRSELGGLAIDVDLPAAVRAPAAVGAG